MKYTITGDNLQFVNVQLENGETFQSNAGSMKYMTGNMTMEAKMKGGLFSGLKRSLSGSSLFLMNYKSNGGSGVVGFGGSAPGKILDVDVGKGSWLVQSSGYLCSDSSVNIDMAFQKKLGSIFFGGEGLILQRLSGKGMAFIAACGDLNIIDLKPGEVYKVSTSNAVAWEETVKYDISATGGFKTALFGGEGLFNTVLTGPGKIWLQTMPIVNVAGAIQPYIITSK